ncbi:RES family NAD+ phosphorylase [Aliarcobacter butzleri]|uniref:RES family NAD+ phosphorylase n=1 Tax=Aliarcobacter butzleri TaxID=28197 RepID=UPI00263C028F|nr:RES family NAD+ phosphorylase [Aliarcobacter butzleri]MDN5111032.1 RES family NAD+ phosphorylase [Aliarcobacter butzleri]
MTYIPVLEKFNICIKCAKDYKLKKYIEMSDFNIVECSLCNIKNKALELSDNPHFANFIRALIRYHYWEDEYNTHFGGESIYDIFSNENPIIYHKRMVDDCLLDDFVGIITDYKFDNEDIVELWYGHIDDMRGSFGERIKDLKDTYILELEKDLLKKNHFLLEESFKEKILNFVDYLSNNINIDSIYYRARIGYEEKIKNKNSSNYLDKSTDFIYKPYQYEEIAAVPIKNSQEGRLNKKGESFLYLATNIETAISEVRPDSGHIVSVAEFRLIDNIKVVDFDKAFIELSKNEKTLKEFVFLSHIEQILSHPVTKDEKHLYFISQFFSNIFRKIGFDGVLFSSSISKGQNLVVFNPDNFKYIENSSKAFDIKTLKYTYKECIW